MPDLLGATNPVPGYDKAVTNRNLPVSPDSTPVQNVPDPSRVTRTDQRTDRQDHDLQGDGQIRYDSNYQTFLQRLRDTPGMAESLSRLFSGREGTVVLSGMSDEAQMEDNISYMAKFQPLNEDEQEIVAQAAEIIKASITIPCTACRYCVSEAKCPKNIAIPDVFAIYNNLKRFSGPQGMVAATYYANLTESHGKAGDCIGCGQCEKHCPQHLPIRDYLRQVSAEMDK